MTQSDSSGSPPTRETLVERAASLVPFLAERAGATERARTMLPEIFERLTAAGLFRIVMPPGLGGFGLDLATHLEVAAELARGCGSTAWLQALIGNQNGYVAWYPRAAQDEVRAAGSPLFTVLVMGPPETARRVSGGVRLSGRWPYVSGVDQASWMLLSARDPDRPARVLTCLMPRAEGTAVDDWYALGLRGTGSRSVLLDDVFVPDHRVLCFREAEESGAPGAAVHPDALYIGAPNSLVFAMVVAAPSVGLARCAIDAYAERLRSRTNARMPSAQTEWPSSQARLGRAEAQWAASKRALLHNARSLSGRLQGGGRTTLEERAMYRAEVVEIVTACTAIVSDLFGDAGTGATLDGSVLQRVFRDIHTLRSHFMIMPDAAAENAGRVRLGLDPRPPYANG